MKYFGFYSFKNFNLDELSVRLRTVPFMLKPSGGGLYLSPYTENSRYNSEFEEFCFKYEPYLLKKAKTSIIIDVDIQKYNTMYIEKPYDVEALLKKFPISTKEIFMRYMGQFKKVSDSDFEEARLDLPKQLIHWEKVQNERTPPIIHVSSKLKDWDTEQIIILDKKIIREAIHNGNFEVKEYKKRTF